MKLLIDINEKHYERIKWVSKNGWADSLQKKVIKGIPLDKIRAEIDGIEINGHIRDVECFRAGINTALTVIDKYRESEE